MQYRPGLGARSQPPEAGTPPPAKPGLLHHDTILPATHAMCTTLQQGAALDAAPEAL